MSSFQYPSEVLHKGLLKLFLISIFELTFSLTPCKLSDLVSALSIFHHTAPHPILNIPAIPLSFSLNSLSTFLVSSPLFCGGCISQEGVPLIFLMLHAQMIFCSF